MGGQRRVGRLKEIETMSVGEGLKTILARMGRLQETPIKRLVVNPEIETLSRELKRKKITKNNKSITFEQFNSVFGDPPKFNCFYLNNNWVFAFRYEETTELDIHVSPLTPLLNKLDIVKIEFAPQSISFYIADNDYNRSVIRKLVAEYNKKIEKITTVKYHGGYWVDKNKNIWSTKRYTKIEAAKASESLTNCKFCSNCDNCIDCIHCKWCSECKNCNSCSECFDYANLKGQTKKAGLPW